jgi:hypothetical protein
VPVDKNAVVDDVLRDRKQAGSLFYIALRRFQRGLKVSHFQVTIRFRMAQELTSQNGKLETQTDRKQERRNYSSGIAFRTALSSRALPVTVTGVLILTRSKKRWAESRGIRTHP